MPIVLIDWENAHSDGNKCSSFRNSENLKIKCKALINVRKPTGEQKITKKVRTDECIQLHMRQDVREFDN